MPELQPIDRASPVGDGVAPLLLAGCDYRAQAVSHRLGHASGCVARGFEPRSLLGHGGLSAHQRAPVMCGVPILRQLNPAHQRMFTEDRLADCTKSLKAKL